jgi:hypothetical protein
MPKKPKTADVHDVVRCTFLIEKPIYVKLSTIRAEKRISMQSIFTEAINAWLSKQR